MGQKKGILIVDDHPLFRKGLKAVLEPNNQFEVVGEARNGTEALEMVRKLDPDLV